MNSLPDDVEPLQRRMSFTAIDTPPLSTINNQTTSNNRATLDKIINFGSRVSSIVTRQAAPTINKLTAQGFFRNFSFPRNFFVFLSKTIAD